MSTRSKSRTMKAYHYLNVCVLVLQLFSCGERKKSPLAEVGLGPLAINLSSEDTLVKARGVDSYVAYIINNKKDTFHIEYGSPGIIYKLYSGSVTVVPLSNKQSVVSAWGKIPSPDYLVFSEYPKEDYDLRIFEKNYWMYDTINGLVSKIVQPKKIGDGMTGLYIPKLTDGMSFSIYANNLDSNM